VVAALVKESKKTGFCGRGCRCAGLVHG
jgi:hypothetical protein